MRRKIFKFRNFKFLENTLNLGIFTHAPLPIQNLSKLYQNLIRKYEDNLEH